MWLVWVISKWACRHVPWKVQVEHWVFRNKKTLAIVALWWLKNSWNWCALSFNISVWFGTFEWEIISEWNLVLKKSLRIQGFFPQLLANLIDSHSKHNHINQQEVKKLSPTEFTPDCLLGGLFTHLFVLWNLGYFSKVVATFNHVGWAVGP